jgi:hypothetical protein
MGSELTILIYVQHFHCIFKTNKVLESGLFLLSEVTEWGGRILLSQAHKTEQENGQYRT